MDNNTNKIVQQPDAVNDNMESSDKNTSSALNFSRRQVLAGGASAAVVAATTTGFSGETLAMGGSGMHPVFGDSRADRRLDSFELRVDAAESYLTLNNGPDVQPVNGDEGLYADFRGSYSKSLLHNNVGEVDPASYNSFLNALDSGNPAAFESIIVGNPGDADRVRLVSPQAAYSFEMFGVDGQDNRMPAAPTFASAETAAEMGELYWYALTRDIAFVDYDNSNRINNAVNDLNTFSRSDIFPNEGGAVTSQTIFRGALPGATTGPMVSQFLLQPYAFGRLEVGDVGAIAAGRRPRFGQTYRPPRAGNRNNFMTDFDEWLNIQNGGAPSESTRFAFAPRHLASMRQLSEYVHVDFPVQSGLQAAFILLGFGEDALCPNNPYTFANSITQQGFASFGPADITHIISHGPRLGLTGAWYQKWLAHRRLRPEVFAGRINVHLRGLRDYDINQEILDSEGLARIIAGNETGRSRNRALLPMGYPEGSPAHPAYPGGHSTFVAAAATILKGFFNEDFEIPNPVQADRFGFRLLPYNGTLTVGGELNKLVGNVTHARDGAGMHWRSDGLGNFIGETQALGVLRDYSRTYNEMFDGFELTLFSGQKVRIQNGVMTNI